MKSTPLIVNWHNDNAPIYSAHFEPNGKRLATAGGDNNVRVEADGEDRKVEYLSTLSKHSQAVNVVRFAPKGELLASAGDDGNVLLWIPAESHLSTPAFGSDGTEDKETWRVKHMCRSSGAEIYDLAWSPDAVYFIIGSMDNIARIYNAQTGSLVRQIADHGHYVQGVAWDPLNEYVATQSSDRSVHIYHLKTKDGQFTLEHGNVTFHTKMDFPARKGRASSPAPSELGHRSQLSESSVAVGSPVPSAPGTPTSMALPMNPPSVISHSRKSSFGSSPSVRRSASPAPSMPLPAVMPMSVEASPKPLLGLSVRNANLYANETLTSFFRRLTFTPEGSLLFTPAGQYQSLHANGDSSKNTYDVINTVYIYTRGGINKPPIAHLPGHKKPSVVVKCSPILYTIRKSTPPTKHITIDTSSAEEAIPSLPEPVVTPRSSSPDQSNTPSGPTSIPKNEEGENSSATPGPPITFSLPYRIVYAVATQDSVLLYDTQQQTPLCVVSNLHCATFTDLTWSNDGLTLLMTSSDGFCSTLSFTENELGQAFTGEVPTPKHPLVLQSTPTPTQNTPTPTPTASIAPPSPFPAQPQRAASNSVAPSPPPTSNPPPSAPMRPSSPTRSNSTSSIATQASLASFANTNSIISNPTLLGGSIPSITAASSSAAPVTAVPPLPIATPPQTPRSTSSSVSGVKREAGGAASESEKEDPQNASGASTSEPAPKKRRIAPTLVSDPSGGN